MGEIFEYMSILGSEMLDEEDNEARATDRLVVVGTGETVGLLYAWEDGVKQPLWFDGERSDVVVQAISTRRKCMAHD